MIGIIVLLVAALAEAVGTVAAPRLALPEDMLPPSAVQMLVSGPVLLAARLLAGETFDPSAWSGPSLTAAVVLGTVLVLAGEAVAQPWCPCASTDSGSHSRQVASRDS